MARIAELPGAGRHRWPAAVAAGAACVALVFALGFVLGALRALLVGDAGGTARLVAVLLELPVMLAASWLACGWAVRRFAVVPAVAPRLLMGGVAFALLLAAELLVGTQLAGRSLGQQAALYREASYALGLAAQVAFGLMPLLRLRVDRRAARGAAD